MKTFSEFHESAAVARGALRLLKSGRVARTADGGRRVTSAARAARNATSRRTMSRAERGETFDDVSRKIEYLGKIRSDPNANNVYRRKVKFDNKETLISGNRPIDKNITVARAAAKKAGLKGGAAKNRVDFMKPDKYYTTYPETKYSSDFKHPKHNTQVDTEIHTIASGRKAATVGSPVIKRIPKLVQRPQRVINDPMVDPRIKRERRVQSTNSVAAGMKEFRRRVVQSGGQERNPVHKVDFIPRRDDYGVKGDLDKYSRKVGRNFMKAQRNLPQELEKAGAKQGDPVVGWPSHMRRGENPQLGREKRAGMYQRTFGRRVQGLDPTERVKYMIGAVGGNVK